ncbi:MAG: aminotransferase class V-fold PLP-dependent enzyme [Gammaproteobacteria bacterium]|nr:aminotransferase class V-fold PLP-dependent enzyme [Gammaproteobacteria bacterium]
MTKFDIGFIRSQFPAFAHPETGQWAFFENAGGSYAAAPVVDKLHHFMTATKMQPYGASAPSREAGEAMDLSHEKLAAAINAETDEVMFGPSTSMNTYVISHAMRSMLQAGDEVIVTNQDHEANIGAWWRMEEGDSGIVVREWQVDSESGLLDISGLTRLLNEKTKLVCVTHCSNIVGAINDIPKIARLVRETGAWLAVDGVSFAPHLFPNVKALDVDFYFFSLYKTFGPHQGLLYVRKPVLEQMPNQSHFFNAGYLTKKLTPAGPQHGEIACASGVVEYLENVYAHHFPESENTPGSVYDRVSAAMHLGHAYEAEQTNRILGFLRDNGVRIIGDETASAGKRAPTIAFTGAKLQPMELATRCAAVQVGIGGDNFYAYRLMQALGIEPDEGVVRISLVHYTSAEDVDRLLNALDEHL